MNNDTAITVSGAGKMFNLQGGGHRTIKGYLLERLKPRPAEREFWALRDVSFRVGRGETLGIIGANGAGKSTLLSLIAGTMTPTAGTVELRGTVASLLELGAGFHPDLTGRENVFLYGAMMGLTRRQMDDRFDAIVEFAELSEFIDQPVKFYSSGMYVRLGFSVAVELDPDILLVDEVLSVGDSRFQRKCLERMDAFRRRNKTMLFISHDMGMIERVSDHILLLDRGRVLEMGEPGEVIRHYTRDEPDDESFDPSLQKEWGSREVEITKVRLHDADGADCERFAWGRPLCAEIHYRAAERVDDPVFGFAIADRTGQVVFGTNTDFERVSIDSVSGDGVVGLRVDAPTLDGGRYLLSFSVHSRDRQRNYHRLDNCYPIHVEGDRPFSGQVYLASEWRV